MATVRKPSSLAARNMRIAISLRLAASSLRSGFVFFISETVKGPREILHCFMVTTRLSSSFSDLENWLFFCAERTPRGMYAGLWSGWSLGHGPLRGICGITRDHCRSQLLQLGLHPRPGLGVAFRRIRRVRFGKKVQKLCFHV